MTRGRTSIPTYAVIGGVAILVAGLAFHAAGARINTSKSIAPGLYWTIRKPVEKGALVQACPPHDALFDEALHRDYLSAGFCPGGTDFLMKRIAAVGHDTVSVTDNGVYVNGVRLPGSAPMAADRSGRALPVFRIDNLVLAPTQILLMADARATSFDARYFGPTDRAGIVSVIVPVLTW